jgi:pimeloyl-ACP methyl ester carboxylesterase
VAEGRYSGAVELAYTVLGDAGKDPVLLLPGLTASRTSWGTVILELSRLYRVYAVDLRGHGESGRGLPHGYVLDQYVADTICFCVDIARAPVALVGHSLGGVIAFEVAAARPDLVRGVVLIDPPLFRGGDQPAFIPPFEQLQVLLRDLHARAAGLAEYESVFGSLPLPASTRTTAEALGREGLRQLALAQASLDPDVLTPAIDATLFTGAHPDVTLDQPLMVLRADPASGTAAFTDAHVARLHRTNPAAVVEMLSGSGHAALTDAPQQVTEHLTRLLATAR